MRVAAFAAIIAALAFAMTNSASHASDVRILAFPDSVRGSWAPSADACKGTAPGKVDITEKAHGNADTSCEISWITVTASRDGPVYSARSICTQTKTGKKLEPTYLLVTPRPDNRLLVRMPLAKPDAQLVTFQKCS